MESTALWLKCGNESQARPAEAVYERAELRPKTIERDCGTSVCGGTVTPFKPDRSRPGGAQMFRAGSKSLSGGWSFAGNDSDEGTSSRPGSGGISEFGGTEGGRRQDARFGGAKQS